MLLRLPGQGNRQLTAISVTSTDYRKLHFEFESRKQIKPFLHDYITSVMDNEWPLMDSGQRDEITEAKFHDLLVAARTFSIKSKSEESAKQRITEAIPEVIKYRYDRIKTRGRNISKTYFFVIYFLEALLVVQYFILTRRSSLSQTILVIHLMILGIMLALIVVYNHPYEGETSNSPREFLPMIERLNNLQGVEFK
jgi:hypothetical protein